LFFYFLILLSKTPSITSFWNPFSFSDRRRVEIRMTSS
jgi:hypothetical protein